MFGNLVTQFMLKSESLSEFMQVFKLLAAGLQAFMPDLPFDLFLQYAEGGQGYGGGG